MLQESSFTYTLCIFVIDFFILGYPAKKWQVYSRKCFWKVRYYLMEDWDVLYHHQDQVCGKEQRKEYWLNWTLVVNHPFSQSYLDQIYLNDLSKRSIFVADMQSFISSLVLLNFLVSNSNLNKINLIKVPLKKVIKVSIFEENENSLIYRNAERESNVLNEVLLYLLNHVGNVPKLNYNFRSIQLH